MLHIQSYLNVRLLRVLVPLFGLVTTLGAQDGTMAVVESLPAMSRASLGASASDAAARRFARFGAFAADLRRIYGDATPVLLWSRDGALTPAARATVDALLRVGERGLDASAIDVTPLEAKARAGLQTEEDRFEFDAMLSVASLKALRALHGVVGGTDAGVRANGGENTAVAGNTGIGGRPRALTVGAKSRVGRAAAPTRAPALAPTASLEPTAPDLTRELRALATAPRPDAILDAAEPQSTQYQLLKASLGTYRTLAERDGAARGQLARIVATLARARTRRDEDLEAGVVVNIPAFQLRATNGAESADTLAMDVVVGVAASHRTPEMRDSIRYIVFAPYWDLPASIVRGELLPIARRDPRLLTLNNYQIIDKRGRVLSATSASVKLVAAGRARIRQLPGGTNSLGRVKFMFPNADDIYLHDTPTQGDFARNRRDQSHGCVRVRDPLALARFLLRHQPEWTAEKIESAMNGTSPVTVKLTRPMPIRLTYETAVARADGSIDFFDDIYGLDGSR